MPVIEIFLVAGLVAIIFLTWILVTLLKTSKKSNREKEKHYAKRYNDHSKDT